jgi:hypothetical protein
VLRYAARRSPQEQLAQDFALLDTNGKGYFDASDLKMIAKTLPSETRVTDADIACMCVRRTPSAVQELRARGPCSVQQAHIPGPARDCRYAVSRAARGTRCRRCLV